MSSLALRSFTRIRHFCPVTSSKRRTAYRVSRQTCLITPCQVLACLLMMSSSKLGGIGSCGASYLSGAGDKKEVRKRDASHYYISSQHQLQK